MTRKFSLYVLIAAAAASSACGANRAGGINGYAEEQAVVYFNNGSSEQAAVYAVSGGEQRRIGTVFAGQLAKLTVPATMVARGTVNIFARLLARNETPQSGSISVRPGIAYEITLLPDLRSMSVLPGAPQRER